MLIGHGAYGALVGKPALLTHYAAVGANTWALSLPQLRAGIGVIELYTLDQSSKRDIVKLNPMAGWSRDAVWKYIHDHDVPYNTLHNQDYPSIGCTHCTRAVRPGEDARAGRWPGFAKTECGLHIIEPMTAPGTSAAKAAKLGN